MRNSVLAKIACCFVFVYGCAEEEPPPSVDEFMENGVLLDATMVRCSANRSAMKYNAECVNAREAINRIARAEEETRRAKLEAESERKRRALRRAQEAASQARRRAEEAAQRRADEAYLFGVGTEELAPADRPQSAEPMAPAPTTSGAAPTQAPQTDQPMVDPNDAVAPQQASDPADLDAIREELKRRQNEGQ